MGKSTIKMDKKAFRRRPKEDLQYRGIGAQCSEIRPVEGVPLVKGNETYNCGANGGVILES